MKRRLILLLICILIVPLTVVLIVINHYAGVPSKTDYHLKFSSLLKWEQAKLSCTNVWFQEKAPPLVDSRISDLLGKYSLFSNRNRAHLKAVKIIKDIYLAQDTIDDVMKIAIALRDHPKINPKARVQALISAKLTRSDMQFLKLPSLVEIMPDDFFPREIYHQAKVMKEECLVLDESFGSDNWAENALWYFREDLMLNSHHWFWHIYYSIRGFPEGTRGDRRGELFYFMHHELLARYRAERMTMGLPKIDAMRYDYVTPLEPYNSHLSDRNSGRNWTARPPNTKLKDVSVKIAVYPGGWYNVPIPSLKRQQDLFAKDVETGNLIDVNDTLVPLDGFSGIDILTDAVESSMWVINPDRYTYSTDGFHDNGHSIISCVETSLIPDNSHANPGVMLGTSASLRDPIIYRHHTAVQDILIHHKNKLTPYSATDMGRCEDIWFPSDVRAWTPPSQFPPNILEDTMYIQFQPWPGLPENLILPTCQHLFKALGSCRVCLQILICTSIIMNVSTEEKFNLNATVRIYMARRFDENMNRFSMEQQRSMFFALDMFPVHLHPGINRIARSSRNSTLTIPFDAWRDLKETDAQFQYCGCGLPHHLLLPIGSAGGTTFDLFAMVTRENVGLDFGMELEGCSVAPLWCGVRGEKYPTMYPMGYPFDRRPYSIIGQHGVQRVVENLEEYVQI